MVDATDAGYYHLMARTTDAIVQIHNNNQIDDIVGFEQVQCYDYFVKENDTDFQVTLTTYSGRVILRAHPGSLPTNFEDMAMVADEDQEIILDIRAWVRSHRLNHSTGLYYICVKGEITSTYTIKVREFQQAYNLSELEDGYSEYFYLRSQQSLTHVYHVPKLSFTGEDIKIEVDLMVKSGENPVMAAKFCTLENENDCRQEATLERVNSAGSGFSKAVSNGQILKLIIDHDENACNPSEHDCVYVIAVFNTGSNSSLRYKIEASHNQNNHIMLQERTPRIDSVNIKGYKYYKFTVPVQDQNISNVSIEINPLHGDSDLIVSRTEMFPSKDKYDKKSSRVGSLVDHVEFSKGEGNTTFLEGTYFIAVYGYTYSTYSIIVNVNRTKHDAIDTAMAQSVRLY